MVTGAVRELGPNISESVTGCQRQEVKSALRLATPLRYSSCSPKKTLGSAGHASLVIHLGDYLSAL